MTDLADEIERDRASNVLADTLGLIAYARAELMLRAIHTVAARAGEAGSPRHAELCFCLLSAVLDIQRFVQGTRVAEGSMDRWAETWRAEWDSAIKKVMAEFSSDPAPRPG